MSNQDNKLFDHKISKNRGIFLLYTFLMLAGYFLYATTRGTYFDALIIPISFVLVFVGLLQHRYYIALGILIFYVIASLLLIDRGLMRLSTLTGFLSSLIVSVAAYGIFLYAWTRAIAIVGVLGLIVLLSIILDLLSVSSGLALLGVGVFCLFGKYLLEKKVEL
ncbi:hypothetical protein [Candidatus Leptofilum sp.]|uniref:hypothetical protein n=1 Tax=Candidatus Leptofilum sp. TaxID=3241576 RepID=UPI003B593D4D